MFTLYKILNKSTALSSTEKEILALPCDTSIFFCSPNLLRKFLVARTKTDTGLVACNKPSELRSILGVMASKDHS